MTVTDNECCVIAQVASGGGLRRNREGNMNGNTWRTVRGLMAKGLLERSSFGGFHATDLGLRLLPLWRARRDVVRKQVPPGQMRHRAFARLRIRVQP